MNLLSLRTRALSIKEQSLYYREVYKETFDHDQCKTVLWRVLQSVVACLRCKSEIFLCEYIRKAQDVNGNYFIVDVKLMLKVKMNFG